MPEFFPNSWGSGELRENWSDEARAAALESRRRNTKLRHKHSAPVAPSPPVAPKPTAANSNITAFAYIQNYFTSNSVKPEEQETFLREHFAGVNPAQLTQDMAASIPDEHFTAQVTLKRGLSESDAHRMSIVLLGTKGTLIKRSFYHQGDGSRTVHHDLFELSADRRDMGIAKDVIKAKP